MHAGLVEGEADFPWSSAIAHTRRDSFDHLIEYGPWRAAHGSERWRHVPARPATDDREKGMVERIRQAVSAQFAKTLGVQFYLPQHFAEKWPGQIPAWMTWQRGRPSVRMAVIDMAAFLAHSLETQTGEQRIHLPETGNR